MQNKHTPQDKNSNFFKSLNNMEKTLNMTDKELNNLINSTIDEIVFGGKEKRRKERARKAKADFFNLNEVVKNTEAIMF